VTLADLVVFTRQVSTMINADLTIVVWALYFLSDQIGNPKLKKAVVSVRKHIEAGLVLSEAPEQHPKVFGRHCVEMVRAGEVGAHSTWYRCASPTSLRRRRISGAWSRAP
jgi:type IV pilus assembly protein PilC